MPRPLPNCKDYRDSDLLRAYTTAGLVKLWNEAQKRRNPANNFALTGTAVHPAVRRG